MRMEHSSRGVHVMFRGAEMADIETLEAVVVTALFSVLVGFAIGVGYYLTHSEPPTQTPDDAKYQIECQVDGVSYTWVSSERKLGRHPEYTTTHFQTPTQTIRIHSGICIESPVVEHSR